MHIQPKTVLCCSCGADASDAAFSVCTACTDKAAHRARLALAHESGVDVSRLVADNRLLAEGGLPVGDGSLDVGALRSSHPHLAVYRARLIWVLLEELIDLRQQWDEVYGSLSAHGLLEEGDDLVDGVERAVARR